MERFVLNKNNTCIGIFYVGLVIYALFSDPTPDQIGFAEILIGVTLVVAAGGLNVVTDVIKAPDSIDYANGLRWLVFVSMMFIMIIGAAAFRWGLEDIIRDVIPFLYFFIPLLVYKIFIRASDYNFILFPLIISLCGVLLSLRHIVGVGANISDLGTGFYSEHQLYLTTDGFVLFSALFLFYSGIRMVLKARSLTVILGLVFLVFASVSLVAMAFKGHRGPLGVFVILTLIYMMFSLKKSIYIPLFLMLIIAAASIILHEQIFSVYELLATKNKMTGVNGRDIEAQAIMHQMSLNIWSVFFGYGFGSTYSNPVVGSTVNYSHMMFGYFLLKSGAFGVILLLIYTYSFMRDYVYLLKNELELALAVLGPISIGMFINGSYRYLSFGVILLLIVVVARRGKSRYRRNNDIYSYFDKK